MSNQITLTLDPTYELWARNRCTCLPCCGALVDMVRRLAREESERRGARIRIDVESLARGGGNASPLLQTLLGEIFTGRPVISSACQTRCE